MSTGSTTETTLASPPSKVAGATLIVGSILSVMLMIYHPHVHAHTLADLVEAFAQVQLVNGLVHGLLIVILGVMVLGFTYLCSQLGWSRPLVRAGMIAYIIGSLAMMTAAMINGFIIGDFVAWNAHASPDQLKQLLQVMSLGRSANQLFSKMGVLATSLSFIFWSLVLLRRTGFTWWVGLFGTIAGIVLISLVLLGFLPMSVHGMLAFVTTQAAWIIAVGGLMLKGRA